MGCLSDKHLRNDCKNPIRCFNCMGWGHTAVNCWSNLGKSSNSGGLNSYSKEEARRGQPTWFMKSAGMHMGPGASSPPQFPSFPDWWRSDSAAKSFTSQPEPILVPWKLKKKTLKIGPVGKEVHDTEGVNEVALDLTLGCLPFEHAKNCEVFQYDMLSGGRPDEDQIPEQLQIQRQHLSDFFELGQPAIQQQPENNQGMIQSAPAMQFHKILIGLYGLKLYPQIKFKLQLSI